MVKLRIILLFLFVLSSTTGLVNCSDKGKITAAIEDGKELEEGDTVPFLVKQNYPNPFNSSTTINFQVATSLHVTIKVLTEDWIEVETLMDKSLDPGYYAVQFSIKKDLPSGEYYYTMEGLGIIQVRKMMVVK